MTDAALAWTPERVLALAPDASSAKAGQGLSGAGKWVLAGTDGQTLWGECQGSGSTPYQVRVDTREPAWRCSCPSRKLPCKHALGLFLRYASSPASIPVAEPPAWVAEWLAMREARAGQREAKAAEAAAKPVDAEAQARRAEKREERVAAGLAELELWTADLVRQGLAGARTRPAAFWSGMAARLVDAQAPGAARLVRQLGRTVTGGEGWETRTLEALGRIHLLARAFARLDALPQDTRDDVRAALGFTLRNEDVLARDTVRDRWRVLGRRVTEDDGVRAQRTWLRGEATGRSALVMSFAAGREPLDASLPPGTAVDADLAYFPGAVPLRATLGGRQAAPTPSGRAGGYETISLAVEAFAAALAANPWIEWFPLPLASVIPVRAGERWLVRDREGAGLPLAGDFGAAWELFAISGGRRVDVFGEWDGDALFPLAAHGDGGFAHLTGPAA